MGELSLVTRFQSNPKQCVWFVGAERIRDEQARRIRAPGERGWSEGGQAGLDLCHFAFGPSQRRNPPHLALVSGRPATKKCDRAPIG
jgi:hypothetical protein